jgi:hypothetical protein
MLRYVDGRSVFGTAVSQSAASTKISSAIPSVKRIESRTGAMGVSDFLHQGGGRGLDG